MPRVNLVPKEERQREFRRQMYIIPVAGVIVIIAGLGGSYLYYNSELDNKRSDLEASKKRNAELSKDVAELAKYDELKNLKQSRQSAITNLYSQRYLWSKTLDYMSFVMPADSWLIDIKGAVPGVQTTSTGKASTAASQNEEAIDLTIEGYTYEMDTIAVIMIRLGLISSLKDVVLVKAEKEILEDRIIVHFWIGANLNQGADSTKPTVAPVTGEQGPSDVTPTTGTSTSPTSRTGTTGTTGRTTGTTSGVSTSGLSGGNN